jgi:hypothetical protein
MRKAARFFALTAGLAVFVTACGGDDVPTGTNSGDPLTTQEALDVYAQLNAAVSTALGGAVPGPAASPGAAMDPITPVSADCPYGGSVRVTGDVDASSFGQSGGNISFTLIENINGCGVMSGGYEFTVDGDPSIAISGDIDVSIDGQNFDISGTYDLDGGFSYTSDDGRSGSCAMNVSVNYGTFAVSGSICGQSLSGTT